MKKRNTFVDFIAAAEHLIKVCLHRFLASQVAFVCKQCQSMRRSIRRAHLRIALEGATSEGASGGAV